MKSPSIKNCFQHCGFVNIGNTNDPLGEDPQRDDPTLQSLYIQLQRRGTSSDKAIETTIMLSDQEIVNLVRGVEEEGEEHNELISCPSVADYQSAIRAPYHN